jgi:ABC-type bacteriocin/lantibiotic exporter with double-glycine peptidase domain
MYTGAFIEGMLVLNKGMSGSAKIFSNALYLENLREYMSLEPSDAKLTPLPQFNENPEKLELRNVTFTYSNTEKPALRGITVTFRRSELTVVLGKNGSGKSTLLYLLSGLYTPDSGCVLINDKRMQDFNLSSIQNHIGQVFQIGARLPMSARENIECGDPAKQQHLEHIMHVARLTQADSFIKKLKYSYETLLDNRFNHGVNLSFGQWQRIFLSRLFISNRSVILLDEPTSSIDSMGEQDIIDQIKQFAKHKICVLVTHRLTACTIADRIIVLENGILTWDGTHEELLSHDLLYAKAIRNQQVGKSYWRAPRNLNQVE